MDANSFYAFTRGLTAGLSRQRSLGALVVGAAGLVGLVEADDAAGGRCKPKCGKCATCKRGTCRRSRQGRRCKPGRCVPKPDDTR